jgi:hypothetical protein
MSADPSVFLMGEEVPPVPVVVYFLCPILVSFGLLIIVVSGRLVSTKAHTRSVRFLKIYMEYKNVTGIDLLFIVADI